MNLKLLFVVVCFSCFLYFVVDCLLLFAVVVVCLFVFGISVCCCWCFSWLLLVAVYWLLLLIFVCHCCCLLFVFVIILCCCCYELLLFVLVVVVDSCLLLLLCRSWSRSWLNREDWLRPLPSRAAEPDSTAGTWRTIASCRYGNMLNRYSVILDMHCIMYGIYFMFYFVSILFLPMQHWIFIF